MPQQRRRARSRSQSRSSSASNASYSRSRKREVGQTQPDLSATGPGSTVQLPASSSSSTNPPPIPKPKMIKHPGRVYRLPHKNSIQRDYLEYKMRTESYVEKKPVETEDDTKNGSSSDEDFTERIKRFERKQQEQKKQQTSSSSSSAAATTKTVFQLSGLGSAAAASTTTITAPTTTTTTSSLSSSSSSRPETVETPMDTTSCISAWQSTSDSVPVTLSLTEVFKPKSNPLQSVPSFVSSFIPLKKQPSESSNSASNEPLAPVLTEPPSISSNPSNTHHLSSIASSSSSSSSLVLPVQQKPSTSTAPEPSADEPQTKKICFAFSRIKPALAYDPLEKSKEKDDDNKEEDSESEESSSDDDIEESKVDDHIKISKMKPKIRFSLPAKIRDNAEEEETIAKLYQRWFKFSWKNYDTGMIPVHLGRVPDEIIYTDFEKLQIRDEMRSIPPEIDLMRDYFVLMHELADYYCSFPDNFIPVPVDGGKCLRMKPTVKRSIPFVGFMRMLNNHAYSYEQLDEWLSKLDWRLLETNRFLESPIREPLHKTPRSSGTGTHQMNGKIAHLNGDTNPMLDKESEIDADFEDEPEVSSVSDFCPEPEPDSMDGSTSADNTVLDAHRNTTPKSSDDDDVVAPFVPLYEGLVEPKIYHVDDRLPPIPVLCSRDPKSSNPVSEEQFFLDKLYNQEYYYSTKEFRIDVVPPPSRPIMFLLESLKERHLPNGKQVPIGQQVLFVMPRYNEDA